MPPSPPTRDVYKRQPKDKVKFKLTEESECDACHDSEVASAQNELCLAGIEDHQDIGLSLIHI